MRSAKPAPKSNKRFRVHISATFVDLDEDKVGAGFEYTMGSVSWADMLELQANMVGLLAGQLAATRARHVGPAPKK